MSYCPLWSSTISPIYGGEKRGRGDKGFGDEGDVLTLTLFCEWLLYVIQDPVYTGINSGGRP